MDLKSFVIISMPSGRKCHSACFLLLNVGTSCGDQMKTIQQMEKNHCPKGQSRLHHKQAALTARIPLEKIKLSSVSD